MASISTPVRALVRASAVRVTTPPVASTSAPTSTNVSGSGWQSGISSAVRLAACIPAMRAVPSTSPLGASPRSTVAAVSGDILTTARATARRSVTGLPPTSTIRARPCSSMWERRSMRAPRTAAPPRSGRAPPARRPGGAAPRGRDRRSRSTRRRPCGPGRWEAWPWPIRAPRSLLRDAASDGAA